MFAAKAVGFAMGAASRGAVKGLQTGRLLAKVLGCQGQPLAAEKSLKQSNSRAPASSNAAFTLPQKH